MSTFQKLGFGVFFMRNAGLEETQAGIKIARRYIDNLRYADAGSAFCEQNIYIVTGWTRLTNKELKCGQSPSFKVDAEAPGPALNGSASEDPLLALRALPRGKDLV